MLRGSNVILKAMEGKFRVLSRRIMNRTELL